METKICSYCHKEKSIEEFRFSQGKYRGECKKCEALKHKEYCKTHKDVIKKINYRKYIKNKDKYHQKAMEKREERKIYNKKYYREHKEYYKKYAKKYGLEHRTQLNDYNNNWKNKNLDKVKEYYKNNTLKIKQDPILKLKNQLRNMIKDSFKRKKYKKSKKVQEICGCSIDDLINYLIMTYEQNYNVKWDWKYAKYVHIDHKKPLKYATTEEDVIKLCHYSNLQLLKAEDNLKKGSKII